MADMFADLQGMGLSPQELNKVAYHRSNMDKPFIDPEGNPVTIYATGIEIPEGPNKGKFVSVPGYVGGKVLETEPELYKAWKKDIQAGKWPIYDTSKELNARDSWLHTIMEKDMQNIPQQPKPYKVMDSLFYKDPMGFTIK
tara:strand:+ start:90 stop:512 length:423 start_codon:yes stop_codon:yes gene_type:complete